eukprot:CAMPEP_0168405076 /NCGR_PEP_ID=MMETSP0228-20121227/24958_1 /TAXON_ID=133427 /ORGANISM="Protoceratium reticulatum, Strain CCCM 535 (=CCMP 1889)" /LENGTH=231 /DNA_ID=CAMNT_0008418699 /DNA_START=68 /DNA_END=759 /DNA_ORIENTATION=+
MALQMLVAVGACITQLGLSLHATSPDLAPLLQREVPTAPNKTNFGVSGKAHATSNITRATEHTYTLLSNGPCLPFWPPTGSSCATYPQDYFALASSYDCRLKCDRWELCSGYIWTEETNPAMVQKHSSQCHLMSWSITGFHGPNDYMVLPGVTSYAECNQRTNFAPPCEAPGPASGLREVEETKVPLQPVHKAEETKVPSPPVQKAEETKVPSPPVQKAEQTKVPSPPVQT